MDTPTLPSLRDELVAILHAQAVELLQGAAADVRDYIVVIVSDMTRALLLPEDRRAAVLKELQAQLVAIGEMNRIRAEKAAWRTFERIVLTASQVLMTLATRAIPGA